MATIAARVDRWPDMLREELPQTVERLLRARDNGG